MDQDTIDLTDLSGSAAVRMLSGISPQLVKQNETDVLFRFPRKEALEALALYNSGTEGSLLEFSTHVRVLRREVLRSKRRMPYG